MKKKRFGIDLLLVFSIICSVFLAQIHVSYAVTGLFTDTDMVFTGDSSDPSTLYQDGIGANSDVGIEICGVGQRYVGGFYAMNVLGTFISVPITYGGAGDTLADADQDQGGGCFRTQAALLTVSPSELTVANPDVKKAAFPGQLWIGYSASSENPGSITTFLAGTNNAELEGSYSFSASFDQSDRDIDVTEPSITFTTNSGSFAKTASDASYGISSDRNLVMGICDDSNGASCSSGSVLSSSSFPAAFSSGLSANQVNDQNTFTRYVVINGLGAQMCIGANLQGSITASPDPAYYSQTVTLTYQITNPRDSGTEDEGGNVDVTSSFLINITVFDASDTSDVKLQRQINVSGGVAVGATAQGTVEWFAFSESDTYTARIIVDTEDGIDECDEADNQGTDSFQLLPVTIPDVYIDKVQTNTFPYPNAPFNVSMHLRNSDNTSLVNASVLIVERNGLSVLAPTQIYNRSTDTGGGSTQDGVFVETKVNVTADANGDINLTLIPTYNKLFLAQYNYTDLNDYIGNYSLHVEGTESDGTEFTFILSGTLTSEYALNFTTLNYTGPYSDKGIASQSIVSQVMDFIYQTFSNFLDTIT